LAHVPGKFGVTFFFYLLNAGLAVAAEYYAKQLAHEIIVLAAIHYIGVSCAVGTSFVCILSAAGAYFTPSGFGVVFAPGAFAF
jgi:hypothetical protein